MTDARITDLTELGSEPASTDVLPLVDVSDTTMAASGTTKKIQYTTLQTAWDARYLLRQPTANWVINTSGGDFDGNIRGDNDANLTVWDAGLDVVAIGGAAVSAQKLTIYTGADANIGVVIKANSATQSANLHEWHNSSDGIISSFNAYGHLGIGISSGTPAEPGSDTMIKLSESVIAQTLQGITIANTITNTTGSPVTGASRGVTGSITLAGSDNYSNTTGSANSGNTFGLTWNGTGTLSRGTGASFGINTSNSGPVTTAIGGEFFIQAVPGSSGTITTAKAGDFSLILASSSGGNITTGYVNYLSASDTGSGAITNLYGLFINNISAGTTNNFSLVTYAGKMLFNGTGDANSDFTVRSDSYDAIFVDASNNSTAIMNHASGKISFFAATPVTKQTALTTQLTTITHTAPGTPDYAIQDFVDVSLGAGWAFASHDEANTVLSVIANLQTRLSELETKTKNYGLLA